MNNLTSVVGILEIIAGLVGFFVPSVGGTWSTALITLGLSTLGISQKIEGMMAGNVGGIW